MSSNRTITISGEINSDAFAQLSTALAEMEQGPGAKKSVLIELNSHGGEAYDGLAMAGRIKASPCPITVVGYGQIFSAASLVLASGTMRKMSRYAWYMVHDGEEESSGNWQRLEARSRQLKLEELQWATLLEEFTGVPKALWLELSAKETYLSADDCLKLGIVQELV